MSPPVIKKEIGTPEWKTSLWIGARVLIYGLLIFLLAEFIRWDASLSRGDEKFSEYSNTEYLQLVFLALGSVVLGGLYIRSANLKYISLLFFALTAASFFRELDYFFDTYLGRRTWPIPVCLVAGYVLLVIYRNRYSFLREMQTYLHSASFGIFSTGFLTTYVFSRLFGRKIFWHAVMEDRYFRAVKNAAEECVELYGYLLILIAIVELALQAFPRQQKV